MRGAAAGEVELVRDSATNSATRAASVRVLSVANPDERLDLEAVAGLDVVRAYSGAARAVALAAADRDLALVDARLRWMAVEELRATLIAAAPTRPIVALTDGEQSSDWERAHRDIDATLPRA